MGLLAEPRSHLRMKASGLNAPTSDAETAVILLASRVLNFLRGPNEPVYNVPTPWSAPDPNADVTPERRAELREQLQRRSAFH